MMYRNLSNNIMDLLQDKANILDDNIVDYDGLIVFISCHGIKDYIISSDYGKINKNAIHRVFSIGHPKSRDNPRIFQSPSDVIS